MVIGDSAQRVVLGVENGYGFIAQQPDMLTRQRAGKQFINVQASEQLLKPLYLHPEDTQLALLTEKGRFLVFDLDELRVDRKSTRLNSSHVAISYAVFCLKKKNKS